MSKIIEILIKIDINNDPSIKQIVNDLSKDILAAVNADVYGTKASLQSISTNVK